MSTETDAASALASANSAAASATAAAESVTEAAATFEAAAAVAAAGISATIDADPTSAFRVQQDARLDAAYVADGSAFADLGKQAGVDPTGVTECAGAINTALTSFASLGVRAYAKGTFKIASTVTIKSNADLSDALFNYTAATGTAVLVGSTTSGDYVRDLTVALPYVKAVAKTALGWAQVAGTIGVDLVNLNTSKVYVKHVESFETNLRTRGIGTGFVHNDIWLGHLDNGKINLKMTAGTGGWCNQNVFYSGRLSHNSGEGSDVAGCYHLDMDVLPFFLDNNTWIGTSWEGTTPEYTARIAGQTHQFLNCRWEHISGCKVYWRSDSLNNQITGGYALDIIRETFEAGAAASNNIASANKTRHAGIGGLGGLTILENTTSTSAPTDVVMAPGARVAGTVPATGYQVARSARYTRMKAAADAFDRVQIDHELGRLNWGIGTSDPVVYFSAPLATELRLTGATVLSAGSDNTCDIGKIGGFRFKNGIFGGYLSIGDGVFAEGVVKSGAAATGSRPLASLGAGSMFYDTTLNKPIWSDGTNWRDAAGTIV